MNNLYFTPKRVISTMLILFFVCLQFNSWAYQIMSTNFYIVGTNGVPTLMDGNMSIYDNQYSNGVDWNDGTKVNNSGENWGLIRNGISLVVERRQFVRGADTVFFNMWGMQQRNYRFEVTMQYFDPLNLAAYVWDNYLHEITPVSFSGITTVNFTVNTNPGSWAAGRFKLIYTSPAKYAAVYAASNAVLPVTITGINAVRKEENVLVSWSVENEISMENYVVESSSEGRQFNPLQTLAPFNTTGSHIYTYKDLAVVVGHHFYRIKIISRGGKITYSKIVSIGPANSPVTITVYPNPVVNKTVQVQWNNTEAATWHTSLVYPNGSRQALNILNVPSGKSTGSVILPSSLQAGTYMLRFTDAANNVQVKTIIVL